ncbi:MAG: secretin N-terminal domain-containing protein [Planctomycetota bacterium]|nr:secretin N-terminal domain-containing protein [Planctomycetota bacterium]
MRQERTSFRCVKAFMALAVLLLLGRGSFAENGHQSAGLAKQLLGQVKTTRPGTFEIHVQGADLRGVLQLLSTQGRKNIIATKEVSGTVTADLYGVTFKEALDAVLTATGHVYEEQGNFIYVYTPKQMAAIHKSQLKLSVRIFRLAYITAKDVEVLIRPALTSDGSVAITPASEVGIVTSSTEAGGDAYAANDVIVVRDTDENLVRIAAIIEQLDVKPDQVLIEATILRATLTEDNALGVDFNTLAGIDFQNLNATTPGIQSLATGTVATGDMERLNPGSTIRTDFNSAIDAGGMTIGFISNEIAFFIRALESVTDLTILANPKLLVLNKQRAEVMIGNRDGYLTTTVTETVATQEVQFLETGTRLVVRPFIGKDGYVRMEIHPEDSSGGVEPVGNNVLPSETTTEVTSNILVRDGHTIVIGGLFREQTQNGRAQVPVVGNIPYLGTLFRRTVDYTVREEVIILITPRIIKQEHDEAVCEQIKDDIERFRVGQRKGLRWWGRERLAQMHMRQARQALAVGDRAKALWQVDAALALEPRMEEAIRMHERLTGKEYWSSHAQFSSAKYVVQRMIMQELDKPVERVIPPRKPRDTRKLGPKVKKAIGIRPRPEDPLIRPRRQKPKPAATPTTRPVPAERKKK